MGDGVLMQQFKLNCGDCYGFRLKKRIRLQIDLQYTLLFSFRDSYELFYKCINIVKRFYTLFNWVIIGINVNCLINVVAQRDQVRLTPYIIIKPELQS